MSPHADTENKYYYRFHRSLPNMQQHEKQAGILSREQGMGSVNISTILLAEFLYESLAIT